jgi:hypothetical protein
LKQVVVAGLGGATDLTGVATGALC